MKINFSSPDINVTNKLMCNIKEILECGWVSIGGYVDMLEAHFRKKFHVKHAIACSCATTGLIIAVKAAGWKNEKVMLPAFTWPSTLYALECNGNVPVFCDIEKDSWLPCCNEFPYNMIAVDIFGSQAPIYPTGEYNVDGRPKQTNVIYDAAHGYGLPNLGQRGLAEVVSLSFTKILTATEGGMILTNDDELAETAYDLRRLSGRMEEINALIALNSIMEYNSLDRIGIIHKYIDGIEAPHSLQTIPEHTNSSVFSIMFNDSATRNAVMMELARLGVETKVYYDPLVSGLPNTDYVYSRILSLPIHDGVKEVQDDIIDIINNIGRTSKTPGKAYLTTCKK